MSTMSVREQILVLARRHGIAMEAPDEQEEMAAAISRLSDNDIKEDEARLALVRLRRAKIITTEQGHDWLLRLIDEEDQQKAAGAGNGTTRSLRLVANQDGWQQVEVNGNSHNIPSGWNVRSISDLADNIGAGRTPPKSSHVADGTPWLTISEISGASIDYGKAKRINNEIERLRTAMPGDVLFSIYGTIGATHKVDRNTTTNQAILIIRPKESPDFMVYCLRHAAVEMAKTHARHGVQANLSLGVVSGFQVSAPTEKEQQRIASVLSTQEAQIEDLRALRDAEKQRLSWLTEELLSGRVRVKEKKGGAPVVVTRDGEGEPEETLGAFELMPNADGWQQVEMNGAQQIIPSAWKFMSLSQANSEGVVELGRGQVISKKDLKSNQGPYPVYSSSVVGNGEFGRYGHYMFDEEMITWSVDGGGDFFYRHKHKFSVTNVCGWMRIAPELNAKFIHSMLRLQHEVKIFDYQNKAHPSVILGQYYLNLPPLPEQQRIAAVLSAQERQISDLDDLIEVERKRLAWLTEELLSGRVRVEENAGIQHEEAAA